MMLANWVNHLKFEIFITTSVLDGDILIWVCESKDMELTNTIWECESSVLELIDYVKLENC